MSKVWSRAAKTEVEIQVSIIVRYITAQPPARTRKTVSAPHLVNPPLPRPLLRPLPRPLQVQGDCLASWCAPCPLQPHKTQTKQHKLPKTLSAEENKQKYLFNVYPLDNMWLIPSERWIILTLPIFWVEDRPWSFGCGFTKLIMHRRPSQRGQINLLSPPCTFVNHYEIINLFHFHNS